MDWGIFFGLGASLGWGASSFLAGRQSRLLPALLVAIWSQIIGGFALLMLVLFIGGSPSWAAVGWGLLAGLFGSTSLVLFYTGMALGAVSIVSAISACGALVPVVFGLAQGDPFTWRIALGIGCALLSIVLVSLRAGAASTTVQPSRERTALLYALGAALGFGMFFIFSGRGTAAAGDGPLWVTLGARAGGTLLLLLIHVGRTRALPKPGPDIITLAIIGIVDTSATALFTLATRAPNLGVVAVLGSLYPVVTLLLSRVFLAERLTLMQYAGVTLALLGVALLATA